MVGQKHVRFALDFVGAPPSSSTECLVIPCNQRRRFDVRLAAAIPKRKAQHQPSRFYDKDDVICFSRRMASLFKTAHQKPWAIAILLGSLLCGIQGQTPNAFVTINRLGDGSTTIQISNRYSHDLTAYVVTSYRGTKLADGHSGTESTRHYIDSIVTKAHKQIPPGSEYNLKEGAFADDAAAVFEVKAGVFEDGTSFGDAGWVQAILNRRKAQLEAIRAVIADVQTGNSSALIPLLKASLAEKVAVMEAARKADFNEIQASGLTPLSNIFHESTEAQKAANLKLTSDDDRRSCLRAVYGVLSSNLSKPPVEDDPSRYFKFLVDLLISERDRLIESKPSLL